MKMPIARWKRRQNTISSQLLAQWKTKFIQNLSVTNHHIYGLLLHVLSPKLNLSPKFIIMERNN